MEKKTAEQAREEAKGLTFEIVWAALMELRETQQEAQREAERQRQEAQREAERERQETQRQIRESQQKTDRLVAELTKNIGGLGNSLGKFTESMFSNELWRKFNELGFPFTMQSPHVKFVEDGKVLAEVDFYLQNGNYVMLVEIKTDLSVEDVDEHLERIAKIRKYMDVREDKRKLVGAVAGATVAENVLSYAHRKGLYVIIQTGDSVAVADAPEGFKVREW